MAQVIKLLEGGKPTRKAPALLNVGGMDFVEDDFMNTLNKESNLDAFIYNHDLTNEDAVSFKDAVKNIKSLPKDHPGYLMAVLYVTDLIQSPATKVYQSTYKRKRDESLMYLKPFIDNYYGGNVEAFESDWMSRGTDLDRASKLGKYLVNLDDATIENMYDEFDFSNSLFKTVDEFKTALTDLGVLLKTLTGLINQKEGTNTIYDRANALGIDLEKWIHGNGVSDSSQDETKPRTLEEMWADEEKALRQQMIHNGYSQEQIETLVLMQKNLWMNSKKQEMHDVTEMSKWANFASKWDEFEDSVEARSNRPHPAGIDSDSDTEFWMNRINNPNAKWKKDGNYISFLDFAKYQFEFYRNLLSKGQKLNSRQYALWKILVADAPYDYIPISIVKSNRYQIWVYNRNTGNVETRSIFDPYLKDEPMVKYAIDSLYNNIAFDYGLHKNDFVKYCYGYLLFKDANASNPVKVTVFDYLQLGFVALQPQTLDTTQLVPQEKQGGTITKLLEGGPMMDAMSLSWATVDNNAKQYKAEKEKEVEAAAKASGLTPEEYKERNEYWNSEDFEFSNEDKLRMAAVAADIVALGASFFPGPGSAIAGFSGLGSFLLDTAADASDAYDGKIELDDFALNTLTNLGLAGLGMLPGGKTSSVVGKAARVAPKIIAYLGMINAAPSIIASYKKLLDSPSSLTRADWSNILDGARMALSGSREVKTRAAVRKYSTSNGAGSVSIKTKNGKVITLLGEQMLEYLNKKTYQEKTDYLKKIKPNEFVEGDAIKLPFKSNIPGLWNNSTSQKVVKNGKRLMTPKEVYKKYGYIPKGYASIMDRFRYFPFLNNAAQRTSNTANPVFKRKASEKYLNKHEDQYTEVIKLMLEEKAGKSGTAAPAAQAAATPVVTLQNQTSTSTTLAATSLPAPTETPKNYSIIPEPSPITINRKLLSYIKDAEKLATINGSTYRWRKSKNGKWHYFNEETGGVVKSKEKVKALDKLSVVQSPQQLRNKKRQLQVVKIEDNGQYVIPFRKGGKLAKYLNVIKMYDGGVSPIDYTWWLKMNGWDDYDIDDVFLDSKGRSNATSVENLQLKFPDNVYNDLGISTRPYTLKDAYNTYDLYVGNGNLISDVLNYYKNFIATDPNGSLEGFKNLWNTYVDKLRSDELYKNRPLTFYNTSGYSNWNKLFNQLYASYPTGYDENQEDILGGATWRRIVPGFKDNDSYMDYRKGLINPDDANSNFWIDNLGHILLGNPSDTQTTLPTESQPDTENTLLEGLGNTQNELGIDIDSDWSSRVNAILKELDSNPELKYDYDLSVPLELSKFLSTIHLNDKNLKNYFKIPVVLETPNRVSAVQYGTARNNYNYQTLNENLINNAERLSDSVTDPQLKEAIKSHAWQKVIANNLERDTAEYKLIETNKQLAQKAADANYNEAVDTANVNNSRLGAWKTNRIYALVMHDMANQDALKSLTDVAIDTIRKMKGLREQAVANDYWSKLLLKYSHARDKLAKEFQNSKDSERTKYFSRPENKDKKEEDFEKYYTETFQTYWNLLQKAIYAAHMLKYNQGILASTEYPWLPVIGINPYPHSNEKVLAIYTHGTGTPSKKKGGQLTYSEQFALLQNELFAKKELLGIKENSRRNLQREKEYARQMNMVSSYVTKLINKALGI